MVAGHSYPQYAHYHPHLRISTLQVCRTPVGPYQVIVSSMVESICVGLNGVSKVTRPVITITAAARYSWSHQGHKALGRALVRCIRKRLQIILVYVSPYNTPSAVHHCPRCHGPLPAHLNASSLCCLHLSAAATSGIAGTGMTTPC